MAHQPEPNTLWPTAQWENVSPSYSGLFFRVLGGNSAEFGTIQGENSPRLQSIEWEDFGSSLNHSIAISANGDWSDYVFTSCHDTCSYYDSLRFKLTAGEVRPRNLAIRIWKRVK